MSFSFPTVDFAGGAACLLESEALTPELIAALGLTFEPSMQIYALWGASGYCVDLLLSAIADEAANRSLRCFSFRSPIPPYRRTALWVEGVGLLTEAAHSLPKKCRLIDLSPLIRVTETGETLDRLNADLCAREADCINLGKASQRLTRSALSLTAPYRQRALLAQKAARIASAQPIGSGRAVRLPVSVIASGGERTRMLPFGEGVGIIGLQELYGGAADFLILLAQALDQRKAHYLLLCDQWSSEAVGLWLPERSVCYLCDPPERREKMMTLSRYLTSRPQDIRARYRALKTGVELIEREIGQLTDEMSKIGSQIDSIEEKSMQKSRFGIFRKRLLIELFCK